MRTLTMFAPSAPFSLSTGGSSVRILKMRCSWAGHYRAPPPTIHYRSRPRRTRLITTTLTYLRGKAKETMFRMASVECCQGLYYQRIPLPSMGGAITVRTLAKSQVY